MNTAIQAAFDHALLTNAAFTNLTVGATGDDLRDLLMQEGTSPYGTWPESLATYLGSRYTVAKVSPNGDASGYNGVLFKGIASDNANHYVFVNAGSLPLTSGYAWTNELGQLAADWAQDISILLAGWSAQSNEMEDFFTECLSITGTNPLTVAGFSLGGFLSLMLREQDINDYLIDKTYTFNGLGLYDAALVPLIFNQLLAVFGLESLTIESNASVENYYTAEGLSIAAATGIYTGQRLPVNTDDEGGAANHGIDKLIDALAVYNLMGMVDSDITLAGLNAIHEAMSKNSLVENDSLVKAFGTLLNKVFNWELDTDINAVSSDNNAMHKAIYEMVKKLQNAPQALQITPLVSFNESGQLQLHTNQDINSLAYRYALKELNPFIVEGINYSSFNQSGQLDDYNEGGAANDTSYRLAA